jgi:hypothetical protein
LGGEVRVALSVSEELQVSWDTAGHSVRVRYKRASDVIVDVYREQATLVAIEDHETGPVVNLEC